MKDEGWSGTEPARTSSFILLPSAFLFLPSAVIVLPSYLVNVVRATTRESCTPPPAAPWTLTVATAKSLFVTVVPNSVPGKLTATFR
jgi:hypothetical protein